MKVSPPPPLFDEWQIVVAKDLGAYETIGVGPTFATRLAQERKGVRCIRRHFSTFAVKAILTNSTFEQTEHAYWFARQWHSSEQEGRGYGWQIRQQACWPKRQTFHAASAWTQPGSAEEWATIRLLRVHTLSCVVRDLVWRGTERRVSREVGVRMSGESTISRTTQ